MNFLIPFVYGTLLGSFLNVCIFRLPRKTSIVFPGSACPVCKAIILWWQNIPLLSYLLLKGKCSSCGSKISFRYPFIEGLAGFLMTFLWHADSPLLLSAWQGTKTDLLKAILIFTCHVSFTCVLLVVTLIDWDYQLILDGTVYFGVGTGLIYSAVTRQFYQALIAAAGAALFFYAVRVVGEFVFLKEAMGEGDVKLAGMLGAFLGAKRVSLAILFSFPIGVLIALGLIFSGLKNRKDYIPFGPALALGAFISAFWGEEIIEWYLRFRFGL